MLIGSFPQLSDIRQRKHIPVPQHCGLSVTNNPLKVKKEKRESVRVFVHEKLIHRDNLLLPIILSGRNPSAVNISVIPIWMAAIPTKELSTLSNMVGSVDVIMCTISIPFGSKAL